MITTELAVAEELAELVGRGDRRALARAISAVEDGAASADDLVHAVRKRLRADARRVAVTGPPGAGKSTLVGKMVTELLAAGRRVGVLLVDPSSPVSGGAVLGDRIRLQRHGGDDLYVRSVAARGHTGGVAATTSKLVDLLEGWGADVVIIETVGGADGAGRRPGGQQGRPARR
jgi:LAO/AO transport system kinase